MKRKINWKFWQRKQTFTNIQSAILMSSASWSSWCFSVFMNEGYRDNGTTNACIKAIVRAAQECPIIAKDKDGNVLKKSRMLDIIKKPNPAQNWKEFLENALVYHLGGGEAPTWLAGIGAFQELWVLRPDWLQVEEGPVTGMPKVWRYAPDHGNGTAIVPDDMVNWISFNPLNRWRGLSPLWSCGHAIDILNQYNKTNKAMLDNSAVPSGVLSTEQNLEEHIFKRLKDQVSEEHSSDKVGKPMVLEGGLQWKQIALSPREMEFIEGTLSKKQDVCEVLRVPPQIIGLPGSQTFANYEEARAALYEDTAIPLVNAYLEKLSKALAAKTREEGVYLCVDIERVAALEPRRAKRNETIDKLKSLSLNEKRETMGYEEDPDGDVILVSSSDVPLSMVGIDAMTNNVQDPPTPEEEGLDAYGKPTKKPVKV